MKMSYDDLLCGNGVLCYSVRIQVCMYLCMYIHVVHVDNQVSVFAIAIAVILCAAFRLLLEIPQLLVLRYRYLLELSNWLNLRATCPG